MPRWTPRLVTQTIEVLEEMYGRPRFIPRFEPLDELVSCILSQHTTDATSFPTFTYLKSQYPEWEQVAALSPELLAEVIRKAGLPNQKAKSILGSLRAIYKETGKYSLEHLRNMPMLDARQWLMSLPGVGPKTASIVLCFGFGLPAIPVDTHVFRVSWRLGIIDKAIGEAKAHGAVEKLVPKDYAFRFHTSFIQHGRQTCKAPTPLCEKCPLTDRCEYFRSIVKSRAKSR